MTVKDAIDKLKLMRSYQSTYGDDAKDDCEALDMAVKALEEKDIEDRRAIVNMARSAIL